MFDFNPIMVYTRALLNNFRRETEKQQASAMMKSIAAKWDSGEQVSRQELDRLGFLIWVIQQEDLVDEHERI